MQIYICSNWRNQHAVEMLTQELEGCRGPVLSFVSMARADGRDLTRIDDPAWIESKDGREQCLACFAAAANADLVIFLLDSFGSDEWAEIGAAFCANVPIYGLRQASDLVKVNQHYVHPWFTDYRDLLDAVDALAQEMEE